MRPLNASTWILLTLLSVTTPVAQGQAQQDDDLIADLLDDLTDRQDHVRQLAHRELVGLGTDAVPALIRAVQGTDAELRLACIQVLGDLGPAAGDARDVLMKATADPEARIRKAAGAALNRIEQRKPPRPAGEMAMPRLLQALQSPARTERHAALEALARMGAAAAPAVPRLTEMVATAEDEGPVVRTLQAIGPPARAAGTTLIARLPDVSESLRWEYLDALCSIRPAAVDLVRAAASQGELGDWFLAVLTEIGEECVAELVTLLEGDAGRDQRAMAATALGTLGSRARAAVPALTAALQDDTGAVRREAAAALGQVGRGAEGALPDLIALLTDPTRRAQVEALHGVTGILLEARRGNSRPAIRSAAVSRTVEDGLQWLADNQDGDGHWDLVSHLPAADALSDGERKKAGLLDTGVTGLATLAFLQAGHDGRLSRRPHDAVVRRALRWLIRMQQADGFLGQRQSPHGIYCHGTATRALLKAVALTGNPLYRSAAERAIEYTVRARNPAGAWRYHPRDGDNDVSVTCWQLLNLKIAATQGLSFAPDAIEGGLAYLDEMTDPASGRTGYHDPGSKVARFADMMERFPVDLSEANTAAAILCQLSLRERDTLQLAKSVDLLGSTRPTWDPDRGSVDLYYWFYGTKALYQYGGSAWDGWKRAVQDALLDGQGKRGGEREGSWEPLGPWGDQGGRVYSTSMAVLALQVLQGAERRYQHDFRPTGRQRAGWRALEKAAGDADPLIAGTASEALRRLALAY